MTTFSTMVSTTVAIIDVTIGNAKENLPLLTKISPGILNGALPRKKNTRPVTVSTPDSKRSVLPMES